MFLKLIFKKISKNNKSRTNSGFSLIEIMMVIAIFVFVASFGLLASMDMYRGYTYRYERNAISSVLQKARGRAIANINQSNYGVHLDSSGYTLFQGSVYNPADSHNENFPMGKTITLSGLSDVVFQQLGGEPVTPGSITLNDGVSMSTITINSEGGIIW